MYIHTQPTLSHVLAKTKMAYLITNS
jgi:hypothetical protein